MWHAEFNLFLYADVPAYELNKAEAQKLFAKIGFTGQQISEERFEVGDSFLSLLCFMGCSPNIELQPQKDKPYCYIEIPESRKSQFVCGKNTRKIQCPQCKLSIPNAGVFFKPENLYKNFCPNCKNLLDPVDINWRKTAFYAKSWIVIGNIYESEAIPGEQLLLALKQLSGVNWKYAYIRQSR